MTTFFEVNVKGIKQLTQLRCKDISGLDHISSSEVTLFLYFFCDNVTLQVVRTC